MDPYALCPCGSGKKVKFCCQAILPEMAKIERLQENNQPRMALQLIDKLFKDHPDNGWLVNQRATALYQDERYLEARDTLVAFLRKNPEHPLANAMLALVMFELQPIESSKKVIHRAFLKSMASQPRIVTGLALRLVEHFLRGGRVMAARQHLAVVARLGLDEDRSRALMAVLDMDADKRVAYPLRGGQPLPDYRPPHERSAQFKKAQRLFRHACFSEAADLLDQLTAHDPNSPELWHTLGLMRAWDGDEQAAAAALHTAAGCYADLEAAVDVEALAQLLDRGQVKNLAPARSLRYRVDSLSRLLTRLDNEDRLARHPQRPDHDEAGLSAVYSILDRVPPPAGGLAELTLDAVPRVLGELMLFDRDDENEFAEAAIQAVEGPALDAAVELFERSAGELAKPLPTTEPEDGEFDWHDPADATLFELLYFPSKTPGALRTELQKKHEERVCETWLQTPQAALQDKSPLEAAGEERLRVPLAAAVRVLDAHFDRRGLMLDERSVRERLQIPLPPPIPLSTETDLNALSISQMQRLDLQALSDEHFERVTHRGLVIQNDSLSYRLLTEFVNHRPALMEKNPGEVQPAFSTLAEISTRSFRHQEALDWIEKGFGFAKLRGSFEAQVLWKLREASLRSRDVQDPAFRELLIELWTHYGAKLPSLRVQLEQLVQFLDYEPPWEQAILGPHAAGSGISPIWAGVAEQSSTEKKLWLPD